MIESQNKALLLVGSPKGENSTSASLGNYLTSKLEELGMIIEKRYIHRLEHASYTRILRGRERLYHQPFKNARSESG